MNRVIGVIAATGCAALLAGGCATTSAAPSGGASSSSPTASAAASTTPKSRAVADAASILQSFVPPQGAVRLTAAPGAADGALKRPSTAVASPDLVDNTSWWRVKGSPQTVLAWEKSHISSRFKATGSGSLFLHRKTYEWSDYYSLPPVTGVLQERQLSVTAVNDGAGQTALRVDAQSVWLPAKPASERVPATAKAVTISASSGTIKDGRLPAPVTITDAATVAKLASLVDGLPVFPPGTYNCPMDIGRAVRMTFRPSAAGPALAVVTADLSGCQNVSWVAGGKSLPGLSGGGAVAQRVLTAAGLHWTGYSGPGTPGGITPNPGPAVTPGGTARPGTGKANPGGGSVNPGGPMQG